MPVRRDCDLSACKAEISDVLAVVVGVVAVDIVLEVIGPFSEVDLRRFPQPIMV